MSKASVVRGLGSIDKDQVQGLCPRSMLILWIRSLCIGTHTKTHTHTHTHTHTQTHTHKHTHTLTHTCTDTHTTAHTQRPAGKDLDQSYNLGNILWLLLNK